MASSVFFPGLFLVLCLAYLYFRRRRAARAMDQAVQMVKLALFGRLRHQYSREFDGIEASLLADAVADFIFSDEPAGLRAWRFRAENLDRIESDAKHLLEDGELSRIVSQAVLAQTTAARVFPAKRLQRLADLGVPLSDIEESSTDAFFAAARSLYKDSNALSPGASTEGPSERT